MNYKSVSLQHQASLIEKYFGITIDISNPPENISEELFVIPSWGKIAPTYNDAVEKVFARIESTRKFYNWLDGKMGPKYLREYPLKGVVPEIVSAQFGNAHKGESIKEVRDLKGKNEILLGVYEVGIMLLTHPDRLMKYEDLGIDCSGDEFSPGGDGSFSGAPCFGFCDGLGFFAGDLDLPCDRFGAGSAILSDTNNELTQKDRNDKIKKCHIKINNQDFKLSLIESNNGVEIKIPLTIKITVDEE